MKEQKLNRSGKRPLAFIGKEIAEESSRDHNSTRWVKATVFETDKGKVIVGIVHATCWQGEHDRFTAEVFTSRERAMDHIEDEAPAIAEEISSKLGVSEMVQ